MGKEFSLSLLIYSGRENPTVYISESEFHKIVTSIQNQIRMKKWNFIPNIGDVGFSLQSPNRMSIDIYKEVSVCELISEAEFSFTSQEALLLIFDVFANLYKGDDLKDLIEIIKKDLLPLTPKSN